MNLLQASFLSHGRVSILSAKTILARTRHIICNKQVIFHKFFLQHVEVFSFSPNTWGCNLFGNICLNPLFDLYSTYLNLSPNTLMRFFFVANINPQPLLIKSNSSLIFLPIYILLQIFTSILFSLALKVLAVWVP